MRKIFRSQWVSNHSATFFLWSILAALLITGLVVVGFEKYIAPQGSAKTDSESLIVRRITAEDHVVGNVSAPIQLIVYANVFCTNCKSFFRTTLPKLQEQYGDMIVVAYRHLPSADVVGSRYAANVAECVAQLGGRDAFWRFVSKEHTQNDYARGRAPSISGLTTDGSSVALMSDCVTNRTFDARVATDMLEASVAGISITPGVVLKSSTRALIVQGDLYKEINSGIEYLLSEGI